MKEQRLAERAQEPRGSKKRLSRRRLLLADKTRELNAREEDLIDAHEALKRSEGPGRGP